MSETAPLATPLEAVALDIGDGAGALVLRTSPSRLGEEIEIVSADDGGRTHVWFLPRRCGDSVVAAAVFGALPPGHYRVPLHDGVLTVSVHSARVTDIVI